MRRLLRPTLGAAAIVASLLGVAVLLLNPPSLSGTEDLLVIVAVAIALVLVSAWATVMLMGRDAMPESEFERVVEHSERLARRADRGLNGEGDEFHALVADAIDRLPAEFQALLEEVPVVVSARGRHEGAYGHYHGGTVVSDRYEDRIVLYRDTLERDFGHDRELLEAQVERTLRHELAHHLGWAERGVRDLGL